MIFFRSLLLCLSLFTLGCGVLSSSSDKNINVSGVIFYNTSAFDLYDVRIKVERTGGVVACGYIPARSECSTTFPATVYKGYPLTIDWQQQLSDSRPSYSSGKLVLHLPEHQNVPSSYQAVFEIGAMGRIAAQFRE